ncbi:DNA topoisomerase 3-alpha [Dichanthelium oligosanthes]|uniref:DNA topoisomerase n=1 Tax=Dichanthelium oligosanthes TaxID=888268 RepID=A0A1E5VWU9_9POAL|nr:DNA topoisomerase 3-alpha [Dichanthelium oligosanthes]
MQPGGGGGAIRVLNVAEKPSVAKAVAEILSRGSMQSRAGRSQYNRVFEFNYAINGRACRMLVTSVTGHLMELEFDDRFRRWHSCDPADLFHAPVRKSVPQVCRSLSPSRPCISPNSCRDIFMNYSAKMQDKQAIKQTLEEEARRCQWLVLWLDCDREGENIAYEVIEVCAGANSHLNIWRARFSALIDREIHESVQHLGRPNKLFADAVDARQEIDLRIGASFTRFQTMLLKDAFVINVTGDDRNLVLSYGPCQFPTLGFIVERFWEIEAHETEEFWTINCTHTSDEGTASFGWIRGHLFDYPSAVILYEMCVEEPTATVQNVRNQEKLKYPPYPLSTVELQKRASRYFRMSSEHTMKVAEELYQAGFISYPRTETDNFSPNTDLHAIVHEQVEHPVWGAYAHRLLTPEARLWRNPSNGGHDDKAHPPIHPTKFSRGENNWSQDHTLLIFLSFKTKLSFIVEKLFGCLSLRLMGWHITSYVQHWAAGIGTDATMHDHIKKLLDRCYATKDENMRFSPTNLGEALVMGYDEMGYELWKPYLRSMMEADMKSVSIGTKSKSEVLESCLQQMKACFLDARVNKAKLLDAMGTFFARSNRPINETQNPIEVVRPCAACHQSEMVLKRRPVNLWLGAEVIHINVVWLPGSLSEAVVTNQVCPVCAPGLVYKIQFKFRRRDIPPNFNVDHLGCVGGCDDILKELMEISRFGGRSQTVTPARGQTPNGTRQGAPTPRQDLHINFRPAGQLNNENPSVMHSQGFRSTHTQNPSNASDAGQVLCTSCGEPCISRIANTDANRGRKFYKCQDPGCGFFKWEDELENATPRGRRGRGSSRQAPASAGRRGRGRNADGGMFVSATGDPVSGGCFTCGDPSHFANACPNRR